MKPLLEPPRSEIEVSAVVVFERNAESFDWNWHYHPEVELTWIREGWGTRLVGDHSEPYQPDDLVILGPNLPHTWYSDKSSRRNSAVVVQFRPQLFPEAVLELPQFANVAKLLGQARRGVKLLSPRGRGRPPLRLESLLKLSGLPLLLELARLLDQAGGIEGRSLIASPSYQHSRSDQLASRMGRVTAYLEKHCREDITLQRAAAIAGLSPSGFSRFFHKMTHRTFTEFRNACRIREACKLLMETDLSITEIAYDCGFENLSNFNRQFRKEKRLVPRDYRRIHNHS